MNDNYLPTAGIFLIIVLVLLSFVAVLYLYITSRHKERLALIEQGMDPNLARSDFWAHVGIIGGGVAVGLIVGDVIPGSTYGPLFAFIFAGAGLVAFSFIRKSKARRNGRL